MTDLLGQAILTKAQLPPSITDLFTPMCNRRQAEQQTVQKSNAIYASNNGISFSITADTGIAISPTVKAASLIPSKLASYHFLRGDSRLKVSAPSAISVSCCACVGGTLSFNVLISASNCSNKPLTASSAFDAGKLLKLFIVDPEIQTVV